MNNREKIFIQIPFYKTGSNPDAKGGSRERHHDGACYNVRGTQRQRHSIQQGEDEYSFRKEHDRELKTANSIRIPLLEVPFNYQALFARFDTRKQRLSEFHIPTL